MIHLCLLLWFSLPGQLPQAQSRQPPLDNQPPTKSAYFAFVDHDYIFTIEMVKPGIPLLNFVSMADRDISLSAKNVRLTLENRKAAARLFAVEPGEFQRPVVVPSLTIHPRSSFGVRIEGDFGKATELFGATIRLGEEDLKLAPLTNFGFEGLVLKVNRLNLGSPDFRDDWRVLRLERLGSRSPAHGKNY
jgi:hypothetical protein